MTDRRLTFIPDAASPPAPRQGTGIVVLDPTWTPVAGDRPDLLAARQIVGRVVERVDLFDRALALVDAWAETTGIADTLTVEGTTYWFRLRETMWRWVHERLLWRLTLAESERQGPVDGAELLADEPALADVLRARWPNAAVVAPPSDAAATEPVPDAPSQLGRLGRLFRRRATSAAPPPLPTASTGLASPAERERREAILADRVRRMAADERPGVIVLTNPGTYQRIGGADGERRDPLFGAVIPTLEARGYAVVMLATGIDQRRDEDWALVEAEDRMLPQFLLRTRWAAPDDDARTERALAGIEAAIDAVAATALDLDGLDLAAPFIDALRAAATQIVRTDVQMLARIERLLDELRPSAIVLAQEGIRTPWLMAGQAMGIPVVAVQHGILYTGHAGYPNRRHRGLKLPTRTCVYGAFERDVLLDLAYAPDDVVVTGSPRLDLDLAPASDGSAEERVAVRRELGVADGDRLLLISTVNLRFVQRSHFVHMLDALFDRPATGVHVVFKQHPGERDPGPYQDLLLGLARAAGSPPPPISVVKDFDLYRLLRAADAHLGLLSTVLTEAVVTGTPDLIAMTDAHTDLLGYVAAGVARPVRSSAELAAALEDLEPPDPTARHAFLDRHFAPGDASARIVDVIEHEIAAAPRRGTA